MGNFVMNWPAITIGLLMLLGAWCGFFVGRQLWLLSAPTVVPRARWETGLPLTGRWLRRFAAVALLVASGLAAIAGIYLLFIGVFGMARY